MFIISLSHTQPESYNNPTIAYNVSSCDTCKEIVARDGTKCKAIESMQRKWLTRDASYAPINPVNQAVSFTNVARSVIHARMKPKLSIKLLSLEPII